MPSGGEVARCLTSPSLSKTEGEPVVAFSCHKNLKGVLVLESEDNGLFEGRDLVLGLGLELGLG